MSRVEASTKKDVHKYTNHSTPPAYTMSSYYDIDAILTDSQVCIQLPRRTIKPERATIKHEQHTHNPHPDNRKSHAPLTSQSPGWDTWRETQAAMCVSTQQKCPAKGGSPVRNAQRVVRRSNKAPNSNSLCG